MVNTVIFDLDGLLADTEKLHMQAHKKVFASRGIDLTDEQYNTHWIRDGKGIVDFLAQRGLDFDIALMRQEKLEEYSRLVKANVDPMPGALELLNTLYRKKEMALATSSYRPAALQVLKSLGIEKYFSCIAAHDNVTRLKPFPDIFLYTAKALNRMPGECLVFEDAQKGVLAASAAHMKCIAVPNIYTKDNDFSKATRIMASLSDVTIQLLDSL